VGLALGTFIGFLQNRIFLGFVLSLGALFGDLIESFIKRRLNLSPGASFPIADQLDFITGALLFSFLVSPPPLPVAIIVLIITPPIHYITNFLAFRLGFKKEPW
jgi:CDP-2,3-bis-(O-geranylgeranyl)-sn-glycerol synthase